MSRSADIFVGTDESLEVLNRDLGSILAKSLEPRASGEESWYEFSDEHAILTLGRHDFVNDRDMPFGQYPYHIGIRAVGAQNEDERTAWRDALANQIFKRLKATKRYRLLLVEDVQVK